MFTFKAFKRRISWRKCIGTLPTQVVVSTLSWVYMFSVHKISLFLQFADSVCNLTRLEWKWKNKNKKTELYEDLTSSKVAGSSTNCTCSALRMPLLMFKTWDGSSGWARMSVISPPFVLKTRSWAWSSSANAVVPWESWYPKGPGFLLWASQSSTWSICKTNGYQVNITGKINRFSFATICCNNSVTTDESLNGLTVKQQLTVEKLLSYPLKCAFLWLLYSLEKKLCTDKSVLQTKTRPEPRENDCNNPLIYRLQIAMVLSFQFKFIRIILLQ